MAKNERAGAAAAQPLALSFAARRMGRKISRQRGAGAEGTENIEKIIATVDKLEDAARCERFDGLIRLHSGA